jgi:hypothetical protein
MENYNPITTQLQPKDFKGKAFTALKLMMYAFLFFNYLNTKIQAVNRTWTGGAGTGFENFNDPDNWNPAQTPTSADNCTVGTVGNGRYPKISATSNCNDLILNGNAYLDFTGAGNLNVSGNLTNNTGNEDATEDGYNGTFTFKGTSGNNIISGYSNFNKFVVDKSNSTKVELAVSTKIHIRHSLKLKEGNIDARQGSSNIFLDASFPGSNWQTAYIDGTGNGEVEGQITIMQYVAETFKTYHYLCNPVLDTNSTFASTSMLEASTDQVDVYNSSYAYPGTPVPDFIYYDEAEEDPNASGSSANSMYGWKGENPLTSNTGRVDQAQGFCTRFKPYAGTSENRAIQWHGIVNNGDIFTPTLTYTDNDEDPDGANVIGNPYPSPIDWQKVYDGIGEFPVIYVWQNDLTEYNGAFLIFDAADNGNSTLPDGIVAIGQGFVIYANEFSSSDFKWKNDYRVNGVDYAFYRTPQVQNALDIKLGGINNKDLTLIHFSDFNSTDNLPIKNVKKMMNIENSIYTITVKQNNNTLNLPFPSQETIIPLGIKIAESGTYYFEPANINLPEEKFQVYLEDKKLKKISPI